MVQAKLTVDIIRDGHEDSRIILAFLKGGLYIDLSGLNHTLGKIKIENVMDVVSSLTGGDSAENAYVKEQSALAVQTINDYLKLLAQAKNGSSAVSEKELKDTYLSLVLDGLEGLTITVV